MKRSTCSNPDRHPGVSDVSRCPSRGRQRLDDQSSVADPSGCGKSQESLMSKCRLEPLFLLVRQVTGDDLELRRRLEGLDDPVGRHLPDEQEQRRGPFFHLAAYLLDELPTD